MLAPLAPFAPAIGCRCPSARLHLVGEAELALEPSPVLLSRVRVGERGSWLCLVDSGAERSVVDRRAAADSDLDLSPTLPVRIIGGGGSVLATHVASVPALELGPGRVEGFDALVLDLAGIHEGLSLVLGQDLLASTVVYFDGQARTARIFTAAASATGAGPEARLAELLPGREWCSVPFRWDGLRPIVELPLEGGGRLAFLIDTGAELSSVSPGAVTELGLASYGTFRVEGSIGGSRAGELHPIEGLRLGPWTVALATGTTRGGEAGVLGCDVLALLPVAIDGPGARLWMPAPPPGAPAELETWAAALVRASRAPQTQPGEDG